MPILALPYLARPFSFFYDASDFAIGSDRLQTDAEGRVIAFESRHFKSTENNYLVHDKELLSLKYALIKSILYLLGCKSFRDSLLIMLHYALSRNHLTSHRVWLVGCLYLQNTASR